MRQIERIIIHCSATKAGQAFTVEDVRRWHHERGFFDVGYHYVVLLDGTVQQGRPLECVGSHCQGYNITSIGICYIGGLDAAGKPADTRTMAQREALSALVGQLRKRFPRAAVYGHRDFARRDCPCFDAHREYDEETNS